MRVAESLSFSAAARLGLPTSCNLCLFVFRLLLLLAPAVVVSLVAFKFGVYAAGTGNRNALQGLFRVPGTPQRDQLVTDWPRYDHNEATQDKHHQEDCQ